LDDLEKCGDVLGIFGQKTKYQPCACIMRICKLSKSMNLLHILESAYPKYTIIFGFGVNFGRTGNRFLERLISFMLS